MSVSRSIICEECNLPRRTPYWFDVCPGCLHKLPKKRCGQCLGWFYRLAPASDNCRLCVKRVSNVKVICARCGISDYPLLRDPIHCRKCHTKVVFLTWKESLPKTIVCYLCGATKPLCKKTEAICATCNDKRRNGDVKCKIPGCKRFIANKRWLLCVVHNADRRAAEQLKRYLKTYSSPFPRNREYLAKLASKINWDHIDKYTKKIRAKDVRRFRAIGDFLKIHRLPEVLTWDAIVQALPQIGKSGRMRIKAIRSCLLDLGHLFAESGLIEDWNSYLNERRLRRSPKSAPAMFVHHVSNFQKWALQGMVKPDFQLATATIDVLSSKPEHTVQTVAHVNLFLNWCVKQNILSLSEINTAVIADYQQTLFWQLDCKYCHSRIPFEPEASFESCTNKKCDASQPYVKVKRLAHASVSIHTSHLRVFFNWAQLHGIVRDNPVDTTICKVRSRTFTVVGEHGEKTEVSDSIRRYDDATMEKLCAYIVSPDADPEEAVVLYLIIFHLFTPAELCNVRIPSLVTSGSSQASASDRTRDYEYLILPLRKFTKGNRKVRRPSSEIKFPREALSWLTPLLKRYYTQRTGVVRAQHHEYLLAGKGKAGYDKPVSRKYVFVLMRRASLRVLGGAVNTLDLRRTAADMFAQRSKRRGAILTMMGFSSLSATRFNYLERFPLQPKKVRSTKT